MKRWTTQDVKAVLCNPVYAFGILLSPEREVVKWVKAFNYAAGRNFWRLPLEHKINIYRHFFRWLDDQGFVRTVSVDVPVIVSLKQWVSAQEKMARELHSKPLEDASVFTAAETVKGFLEAAITEEK